MNERIKELYQQAHSIRRYDGDPALDGNPPTVYWQGETSAERFAELIVRENINLLRQEWYDLNNAPKEENATPRDVGLRVGRKTEVVALINKISKHFGIEHEKI